MTGKRCRIITAALAVVIIAGGVFGFLSANKYRTTVITIIDTELPMEQAVRETEVSVWETANSIFYYMIKPSAVSLEEYKKQLRDVENFMTKYADLVETNREKMAIEKFLNLWNVSVTKAEELIELRDKMKALHEQTWDVTQEADDVMNYKIKVVFVEGLPDLIEKKRALYEVEISLLEAMNAINYYAHRQFDKPRRKYTQKLENVNEYWNKYKNMNLTSSEKSAAEEFEEKWNRSEKLMGKCFNLSEELNEKYLAFWESVHEADDVIDFEIQEHLKKRIENRTNWLIQK